jgi:hypothetical protein
VLTWQLVPQGIKFGTGYVNAYFLRGCYTELSRLWRILSHFDHDYSMQNAIIQLWVDLGDILKQYSRLEGVTDISELNYRQSVCAIQSQN